VPARAQEGLPGPGVGRRGGLPLHFHIQARRGVIRRVPQRGHHGRAKLLLSRCCHPGGSVQTGCSPWRTACSPATHAPRGSKAASEPPHSIIHHGLRALFPAPNGGEPARSPGRQPWDSAVTRPSSPQRGRAFPAGGAGPAPGRRSRPRSGALGAGTAGSQSSRWSLWATGRDRPLRGLKTRCHHTQVPDPREGERGCHAQTRFGRAGPRRSTRHPGAPPGTGRARPSFA